MHAFVQILNPKVFFWANLVTKTEVLHIDWNLVQIYIALSLFRIQCQFFKFFLHSYFLGRIWSQNLKFSKLTEIWYQGTLLYVYNDFNICFCKIFVIHSFLGKFGSNLVPNSLIVNSFSVSQNSNCYVRVHEVHFTIR